MVRTVSWSWLILYKILVLINPNFRSITNNINLSDDGYGEQKIVIKISQV